MAFTPKSWQDHLTGAFGQESETAQSSKDGLTTGGVYNATEPTISDGEFSRHQVDPRGNLKIARVSSYKGSVTIVTPKDAGTLTPAVNGLVRYITIKSPALTGTGTVTTEILDSTGGTYFSQAQDEAVTTTYGSIFPLVTSDSIVCTANGTQDATGTIVFEMHYER